MHGQARIIKLQFGKEIFNVRRPPGQYLVHNRPKTTGVSACIVNRVSLWWDVRIALFPMLHERQNGHYRTNEE